MTGQLSRNIRGPTFSSWAFEDAGQDLSAELLAVVVLQLELRM